MGSLPTTTLSFYRWKNEGPEKEGELPKGPQHPSEAELELGRQIPAF